MYEDATNCPILLSYPLIHTHITVKMQETLFALTLTPVMTSKPLDVCNI